MRRVMSLRASHTVVDAALAAAVIAFVVAVSPQLGPDDGERALDAVGYASIVVAGGALAFRRRWPLPIVAVVTAALTLYLARDYPGGPVFLTALVALYSLATTWERRRAFVVAAAASGWLILVGLVLATGPGLVHLVFAGWSAAAVLLGDGVRSRRDHLATLEERAVHLEASREQEAARRVAEERLRIARDLHDSVAHSMTAINVQAGTAVHVMDRQPERAREALLAIQQQSRHVLEELSALLGILRERGESPARAPAPDLDAVDALVVSARRAGLDVRLYREGASIAATPAIGVAAYRIVQESLTNVVRHAGPGASATVTVIGEDGGGLTVEVADDGDGVHDTAGTPGVGITGMRERAESTGGTLAAGPRPGGAGFVVRARWPRHP